MEIYNTIANWAGWPIVVAIGIVAILYGRWILTNRIESLQERVSSLEADLQIFSVDSVIQNLASRHKFAIEEIEKYKSEKMIDHERLSQLENDRDSTAQELNKFASELFSAFFKSCEYKCAFCFMVDDKQNKLELPMKHEDKDYIVKIEAICKECGHKTIEITYPGGERIAPKPLYSSVSNISQ
jgi:hypothetical protein